MKTVKPYYFNTYAFRLQFLLLLILSFFLICCVRKDTKQVFLQNGGNLSAVNAVNINTALSVELEKLPFIGTETAQNIIEHREKYGKFRRAEHLLLVRGVSDKKFRQIKNMVKVE